MTVSLEQWGIDVDVSPRLGLGFRVRGTYQGPTRQLNGKLFTSVEVKSVELSTGVFTSCDNVLYKLVGQPLQQRNKARIEHILGLDDIVINNHGNVCELLNSLQQFIKSIQPVATGKTFNNFNKPRGAVFKHNYIMQQIIDKPGTRLVDCQLKGDKPGSARKVAGSATNAG